MKALILALTLIATQAHAAEQFDLQCTGTEENVTANTTTPETRHYRIDLKAKQWCMGDCANTREIQQIEGGMITFSKSDPSDHERESSHWVNRATGAYTMSSLNHRLSVMFISKGTCEPVKFSGFPKTKF